MKKRESVIELTSLFKDLEKKKKKFLHSRYTQYIVDYKIEGDYLRVISNTGRTRKVLNTKENATKLNQTIVKSKIDIAHKIDEFENTSKERLMVILVNMILLCGSGAIVPFAFFMGNYLFFLLSVCLFSVSVLTISIILSNYYVLVNEIRNLKVVTGYKKELEFRLPKMTNK